MSETENQPLPRPLPKNIATESLNPRCADCIFAERDLPPPGVTADTIQLPLRCHLNPPIVLIIPTPPQVAGGIALALVKQQSPQQGTAFTSLFPMVAPDWWCAHFDDGVEPAEAH